ncbi:hypothetical protein [Vibrio owensii]|uniref:hypothetical protein n=1 Tax=Vibrio owensii TaxID=696485 RepID=UPI003CC5E62B
MNLIEKLKNQKEPELLDAITMEVDGVKVHVYGVLHGITGGSNKDYVATVNKTIDQAPGKKYCEKMMKTIYRGLDFDVNDWLAFRPIDTFKFAFESTISPRFLYYLASTIYREKTTQHSRFGQYGVHTLNDAGGSLKFHTLDPHERRILSGFPTAEEYMALNYMRRNQGLRKGLRFSDKDWVWLDYIEPNANIPYRSIHMIEYALAHAKKHGFDEISLFVGEIHNSDIEWYVSNLEELPDWLKKDRDFITKQAQAVVANEKLITKKRLSYLFALTSGACVSWGFYLAVGLTLWDSLM